VRLPLCYISRFMALRTGDFMDSITVDGKTYKLENLSTEGRQLAQQASATSGHIKKLEARLAIARTAQSSYLDRLKDIAGK